MGDPVVRRWSDGGWAVLVLDDEVTPRVDPVSATLWPRDLSRDLGNVPCPGCGASRPIRIGAHICQHVVDLEVLTIGGVQWCVMYLFGQKLTWDLSQPEPVIGGRP